MSEARTASTESTLTSAISLASRARISGESVHTSGSSSRRRSSSGLSCKACAHDRPPASQLPAKPDLRYLKDQAKEVLRSGKVATLAAAFFEVARGYGFSSWPKLKSHVLSQTNAAKLKDAITQNDLPALQALFAAYPEPKKAPIGRGGGPLTWAAECRGMDTPSQARLDLVRWLIDDGADVHEGGDTPLMRAGLFGRRIPMMELLVERGANVNGDCNGGYLILFAPCETLEPDSLAWLLQHGADPNCGDAQMWRSKGRRHPGTALDYVLGTYGRNKEALNACIELLQRAGGRSKHDQPGVLATIRGDVDAVRDLIEEDRLLLEKPSPRCPPSSPHALSTAPPVPISTFDPQAAALSSSSFMATLRPATPGHLSPQSWSRTTPSSYPTSAASDAPPGPLAATTRKLRPPTCAP